MMIEEFEALCGCDVDRDMYYEEVELVYMTFDWLSKKEIAAMYLGAKSGAYALWMRAKSLAKEHECLSAACRHLRRIGMESNADGIMQYWQSRADKLKNEVKKLKIA